MKKQKHSNSLKSRFYE